MSSGSTNTAGSAGAERIEGWVFSGGADASGGPLAFYVGIPARDLDAADVAALSDELYAVVVASELYAPKRSGKAVKAGAGDAGA